jgi:hypothetical protein
MLLTITLFFASLSRDSKGSLLCYRSRLVSFPMAFCFLRFSTLSMTKKHFASLTAMTTQYSSFL